MRKLIRFFNILVVLYVLIFALAWSFRIQLIYPFDPTQTDPKSLEIPEITAQNFTSYDGTKLVLWTARAKRNKPTVVYFHGNAGNLAVRSQRFERFINRGYGLVAMAYRGSSGSQGSPSEDTITQDAQHLADNFDKLISQNNIPKTIYFGESLGTGVAVKLATTHPPDGIVLEAPYTSVVDLAAKQMPYFPIRNLLDERWETLERITDINVPLMVLHGQLDNLIPVENGKAVFNAAGSTDKTLKILADRSHSNLWSIEGQTAIFNFINGI